MRRCMGWNIMNIDLLSVTVRYCLLLAAFVGGITWLVKFLSVWSKSRPPKPDLSKSRPNFFVCLWSSLLYTEDSNAGSLKANEYWTLCIDQKYKKWSGSNTVCDYNNIYYCTKIGKCFSFLFYILSFHRQGGMVLN